MLRSIVMVSVVLVIAGCIAHEEDRGAPALKSHAIGAEGIQPGPPWGRRTSKCSLYGYTIHIYYAGLQKEAGREVERCKQINVYRYIEDLNELKLVKKIKTDGSGFYAIDLEPGKYYLAKHEARFHPNVLRSLNARGRFIQIDEETNMECNMCSGSGLR